MRKKHSPHGNVGPNFKGDKNDKKRCNCCNFCNGLDGVRVMHKDPNDLTGGWICAECKKFPLGESKDFEEESWYQEAIYNHDRTVDGDRDYDEMIEDLVTDWEKSEGR